MSDPYYQTSVWRRLRKTALQRDGYQCTTPGCHGTDRLTVDHIVSRRAGGADELTNLRTLCGRCDGQVKELASGVRRGGGADPRATGCHPDGTPRDPRHWWGDGRAVEKIAQGMVAPTAPPVRAKLVSKKFEPPSWA
jgi:hypothetical protein